MSDGYFHRVARETRTRLWINNPSASELELALGAGAISCTTNPTYGAKLFEAEPDFILGIIDSAVRETSDDDLAAEIVQQHATARIRARLMPYYERSRGGEGFVTIQSDPRKDENPRYIVDAALLKYPALGPNFMAKVPVTAAGLEAIEILVAEGVPICATEVFTIDQTIAVCELYLRASQRAGKRAPFYVTHITGILDEYLSQWVARSGVEIAPEVLGWAGCAVAREEYRLLKQRGYPATLLGGGARSTRHFTDFVGGDLHITINWSTAQELIRADPPVAARMTLDTPAAILEELTDKLPDFRRAFSPGALPVDEFAEFGPVQHFRNKFIAGYELLVEAIRARRWH